MMQPQNFETESYINFLVEIMTGYSIHELPPEEKDLIILDCINVFKNYINTFIKNKYGEKFVIKLNNTYKFGQDPFVKFREEGLGEMFEDAMQSFIAKRREEILKLQLNLINL